MILLKVLKRLNREFSELILFCCQQVCSCFAHSVQRNHSLSPLGIEDRDMNQIHKSLMWFNKINYGYWQLDRSRLGMMISLMKACSKVPGEFAECGVFQGKTAQLFFNFKSPEKTLYLFDTFTGFTEADREAEKEQGMGRDPGRGHVNTSADRVRAEVSKPILSFNPKSAPESVVVVEGEVEKTLNSVSSHQFSFVHLDMDLYAPTKFALNFFREKMSPGGVILLHDYAVNSEGYSGVAKAVAEIDMTGFTGPIIAGDQSSAIYIRI